MSETLSRRVGRLVSGGFHALIDAAENLAPEAPGAAPLQPGWAPRLRAA